MLAKTFSGAVLGIEGYVVRIEVDIAQGLPCFEIVGLPDTVTRESKERVRAALKNSGQEFPIKRITVNLAPATIRKEGTCFDLPIAIGIVAACGGLPEDAVSRYLIVGELSLDGELRETTGILPIAEMARREGWRGIIVPTGNAREAAVIEGIEVYPFRRLDEVLRFLAGDLSVPAFPSIPGLIRGSTASNTPDIDSDVDFSDVKGHQHAKRALEVAVAGGHNVLMIGPPGSGKTMLARRIPTILPPLERDEAIQVTKIYSIAGLISPDSGLVTARPFRAPHHTASDTGMIGGGKVPRPGEISLAHRGVLFLDELPEFRRNVLESLRQPLEDGVITISRASGSVCYPARFTLIATSNPCQCGFFGDPSRPCTCSPQSVRRYMSRVSGPLLDRIDMHIEVPRLTQEELISMGPCEPSASIRERVMQARSIQAKRFRRSGPGSPVCNAEMGTHDIKEFCMITRDGELLLENAMTRLRLSGRAYFRILKVARTIADLAASDVIRVEHVAEAIQYRALDRKWWD
ncbi:MAG TPA: YifB family Mg chelatase-like AAA ATPase [Firmicutes bacterium]|nr:YifB family Mg chelatase-like AAA ATPase [Bacillota bacterium]